MGQKRLTEAHPSMKKLREVEDLMAKLKVDFEIHEFGIILFTDNETGKSYKYREVEGENPSSIPCMFETKLTFSDDE